MSKLCATHCPDEGGGDLIGAVVVVGVAMAAIIAVCMFIVAHIVLVLIGAVVSVAGAYGFVRYLLARHTVIVPWNVPGAPVRPAVSAAASYKVTVTKGVPAAVTSGPQAIEAPRQAIPVITDLPERALAGNPGIGPSGHATAPNAGLETRTPR